MGILAMLTTKTSRIMMAEIEKIKWKRVILVFALGLTFICGLESPSDAEPAASKQGPCMAPQIPEWLKLFVLEKERDKVDFLSKGRNFKPEKVRLYTVLRNKNEYYDVQRNKLLAAEEARKGNDIQAIMLLSNNPENSEKVHSRTGAITCYAEGEMLVPQEDDVTGKTSLRPYMDLIGYHYRLLLRTGETLIAISLYSEDLPAAEELEATIRDIASGTLKVAHKYNTVKAFQVKKAHADVTYGIIPPAR